LKPEDFALGGNRPEPPPSDRIRKEVWTTVMALPDDVAVRTTNHHGSALARLNAMRWAFLDVLDDPLDRFSEVLIDVGDEFEAALVSSVQGYYRQGASSLRTAAELAIIGAACNVSVTWADFDEWRRGNSEIGFGRSADRLLGHAGVSPALRTALFAPRNPPNPGGWSRRLYKQLSNYAHSRPQFANADIWKSSGPIYIPQAFLDFESMFIETFAFSMLLVRIGSGGDQLPETIPAPYHKCRSRVARLWRDTNSFLG
jgi:hypothetical protein